MARFKMLVNLKLRDNTIIPKDTILENESLPDFPEWFQEEFKAKSGVFETLVDFKGKEAKKTLEVSPFKSEKTIVSNEAPLNPPKTTGSEGVDLGVSDGTSVEFPVVQASESTGEVTASDDADDSSDSSSTTGTDVKMKRRKKGE